MQISPTNTHGDWIVLSEKRREFEIVLYKVFQKSKRPRWTLNCRMIFIFNTYGADIPGKPLSMGMGNNLTNIGVLGAVSVMTDQVAYEFNCESMLKVESCRRIFLLSRPVLNR